MNLKDYMSFRWFYTTNNNLVIGGKNEDQNELVIKEFLKPNYFVLHTSAPGSSFMIINSEKPTKKEIYETAIFCGCFSKQWKLNKKNEKIEINIFRGNQIYKNKNMKKGTFGVKGHIKKINVKPELALIIKKDKLTSVPNVKRKEKILVKITQGRLSKEEAYEKIAKKIKNQSSFKKEDIMTIIPSGMMEIE